MQYENYQNLPDSACRSPQIPFYRRFFENYKGPGTSFQVTFFTGFLDKNVSFVILHKLAKFQYKALFTSQVIQ